MEMSDYWFWIWIICALVDTICCHGCSSVDMAGIRYHTTRRGRYSQTRLVCPYDMDNRTVYKQDKGPSYMYFHLGTDGWQGWRIGSTLCDGSGQVRVEDASLWVDNITALWEELYIPTGTWEFNPDIKVYCAGLLTVGAMISILLILFIITVVLATLVLRKIKLLKTQPQRLPQLGGSREMDYINDGAEFDPDDFVPPSVFTLPDYDDCVNAVPPAYDEIACGGSDVTFRQNDTAGSSASSEAVDRTIEVVNDPLGYHPSTMSSSREAHERTSVGEVGGAEQDRSDSNSVIYEAVDVITPVTSLGGGTFPGDDTSGPDSTEIDSEDVTDLTRANANLATAEESTDDNAREGAKKTDKHEDVTESSSRL